MNFHIFIIVLTFVDNRENGVNALTLRRRQSIQSLM